MSNLKYQEALDRLLNDEYDFPHDFYEEDKATAMEHDIDTLQELVDKATPRKIDMMRYEKYDGYNIGICKCGKTIDTSLDDEINYCPKCGQRIDWRDKNEC